MTQQIFSCEIVNSELENGFSSENDLEHSLQVNGFSPEWVLGGFWDFLIPKMTWNILYKEGKESFLENGFNCAQCDNSLNKDQNGPVLMGNIICSDPGLRRS